MADILEYCALNISASPHPHGVYRTLFDIAGYDRVQFWGNLFASFTKPIIEEDGIFCGRLVIWTEIDVTKPVVDIRELQEVDITDFNVTIPENIGFNARVFNYAFRERDHILFVEIKNDLGEKVAPLRIERIFEKLFARAADVSGKFIVEVTLIPESDTIEKIFKINKLKNLYIHIVRPNADDLDVQDILDELDEQNAKNKTVEFKAMPGSVGIQPNEYTRKQARVAAHNGYVVGSGEDANREKVSYSTKKYPRIIRKEVPEGPSLLSSLISVARQTFIRIL